eukprot:jgi/Orpsp1_1/1183343/evm.model.c7180000084784.1
MKLLFGLINILLVLGLILAQTTNDKEEEIYNSIISQVEVCPGCTPDIKWENGHITE